MRLTWHPFQCEYDGDWTLWLCDKAGNTVATLLQDVDDAELYRLEADFMSTVRFRALDLDLALDKATERVMARLEQLLAAQVDTIEVR